MKKSLLPALLIPLLLGPLTEAVGGNDWSYSGKTGPENWGNINEKYTACLKGKNQSPVNITNVFDTDLPAIQFDYNQPSIGALNNGQTAIIFYTKGGIKLGHHSYNLDKIQFQHPSEHQIMGKTYPLEAQFIHKGKDNKRLIVSVLFRKGVQNKALAKILERTPTKKDFVSFLRNFAAKDLLPRSKEYYRINGSLTRPPCTEGVSWLVMKRQVTISAEQIKQIDSLWHHSNNRPVQPINSRIILE